MYCVDNILCKVADPHFIGFAISNEADVATKCVPKQKGELVGSVCLDRGLPRVVEYSELGAELAEQKTPDGKYLFGAGSIANHFFTMNFMDRFVIFNLEKKLNFKINTESALHHLVFHIIVLTRRFPM